MSLIFLAPLILLARDGYRTRRPEQRLNANRRDGRRSRDAGLTKKLASARRLRWVLRHTLFVHWGPFCTLFFDGELLIFHRGLLYQVVFLSASFWFRRV